MQRVEVGNSYPLLRVVFSRNGKPRIYPRATSFHLRYTIDAYQKCEAVGGDIDAVFAWKIEIKAKLRSGLPVGLNLTLASNLKTLASAANQYFENLAARGLDIKTIRTY
jgi:hypothetical protein